MGIVRGIMGVGWGLSWPKDENGIRVDMVKG